MPYMKNGYDHKTLVPYDKYLDALHGDFEFVGNEEDLQSIVKTLFLPDSNSVMLTGPSGVGKRSRIHGLVQNQQADFMPNEFLLRPLYRLNVNKLFESSTTTKTEEAFTEVLQDLRNIYQRRGQKPVLIIDDGDNFVSNVVKKGHHSLINRLTDADQVSNYVDLIMSVTESGQKQLQEHHTAFLNGFSSLSIEEPSDEQIMRKLQQREASKHEPKGVTAPEKTMEKIIDLTRRYPKIFPVAQPKRAVRFLDEAATTYKMEMHSQPEGVPEKQKQLEDIESKLKIIAEGKAVTFPESKEELESTKQTLEIEIEQTTSEWKTKKQGIRRHQEQISGYEGLIAEKQIEIKKLEDEDDKQLEHKAEQLRAALKKGAETGDPATKGLSVERFNTMTTDEILDFAEVDKKIHKNPKIRDIQKEIHEYERGMQQAAEKMQDAAAELDYPVELPVEYVEDLAAKLTKTRMNPNMMNVMMNAEKVLGDIVLGQDDMINPIGRKLRIAASGGQDPNKPLGNFLILGPSGVGKTFIAETMAEEIFGSQDFLIRFSMETYQEEQNVSTLLGSARGLVGSDEPGELIRAIQERPYAVLLLDEIEKAHKKIKQALLGALDKGVLVGMDGSVADLRNIIVVQTSNYGQEEFLDPGKNFDEAKDAVLHKIYRDGAVFSPEYLNRAELVVANFLSTDVMHKIAERALKKQQKIFNGKHPELKFEMADGSVEGIVDTYYKMENGARVVENVVKTEVGDEVAKRMMSQPNKGAPLSGTLTVRFTAEDGFTYNYVTNDNAKPAHEDEIESPAQTGTGLASATQAFKIA